MIKYEKMFFKDAFKRWSVFRKKLNDEMDEVSIYPNGGEEDLKGLFKTRNKEDCMNICIFAKYQDRDIGIMMYSEHKDCIDIRDLYVEPEYRNKGIGTEFINKAKDISNDKKIFLGTPGGNERALKLYQKNGFVITGYDLQFGGESEK